jgi:prephenate dehydratase
MRSDGAGQRYNPDVSRRHRVSFQGERGAFSQVAVQQLLGPDVEVVPCQRFEEVFRSLADGAVDAAVIPIENTLHGSVHENYDHLVNFELPIRAETNVRVSHSLIACPGVPFEHVRRVYSHPVALNQCTKFFHQYTDLEQIPFYDTAGSVKMLMEQLPRDAAAIASSVAADMYGATVLKSGIEDDPSNFTRFFLLEPAGTLARTSNGAECKTSLVFQTRNVPGALFRCLSAFALRDISCTKIESRPLRGRPWEYWFYLDFLGSEEDPVCQKALGHLAEFADFLRVLGSYPKAV